MPYENFTDAFSADLARLKFVNEFLQSKTNLVAEMEWERQAQQALNLSLDQVRFTISLLALVPIGLIMRLIPSPAGAMIGIFVRVRAACACQLTTAFCCSPPSLCTAHRDHHHILPVRTEHGAGSASSVGLLAGHADHAQVLWNGRLGYRVSLPHLPVRLVAWNRSLGYCSPSRVVSGLS
jgi:hypothetical protein